MGRFVFSFAIVAAWCGCSPYSSNGTFNCSSDTQCTGGPGAGTCVGGFCAFADGTCTSGERYGDLAGGMSNQCVGANGPDARVFLDAPADSVKVFMDAPVSGTTCYGMTGDPAQECFPTITAGSTANLTGTIDTSVAGTCLAGVSNANLCVIAADTVTTSGTVKVIGPKPLVVIGATSITVSSIIDVASHSGLGGNGFNTAQTGAGAIAKNDVTNCNPGTAPGTSGGGAGGSLATAGANGGGGGAAGTAGAAITPNALRGGCYGQNGNHDTPGVGGFGGGALALISTGSITISMNIDASGAGGTGGSGGNGGAGGGGGGSGGFLVFDAPTITNTGNVFANGGGGGGGESDGGGTLGGPGHEPNNVNAAAGGTGGGSSGGAGGAGASRAAPPVAGAQRSVSGGGGGGSLGVIRVFGGGTLGGMVSPAPS